MKTINSIYSLLFLSLAISAYESSAPEATNDEQALVDTYVSMGNSLREQNNCAQAVIYLREALRLRPDNGNIMFDLANALNINNQNDESLSLYYQLLTRYPNHKIILYNTAYTLKKLGRVDTALLFYDAALAQDQEYAEAHFSRSLARLAVGNWQEGWPEYEWRWNRPGYPEARQFQQPLWDGSDLHGKTIYLHAEQGLGDTFQFIRYAKILKEEYGARVIVSVQKPLVTLIKLCSYIDEVFPLFEHPTNFDTHAPLMSLPYILKTTIEKTPAEIPYLYADQTLVEEWKQKLAHDKNFKVGICWNGNSHYQSAALRAVVAAKCIPLKEFARFGSIEGVSIYSLQKETGMNQLDSLPENFKLHTFGDELDNAHGRFMDTAAIMKNLDLVISIDTSTAHLAAALGTPVWIFIPTPPDWRWMLDSETTPWYPQNMRLFRQPTIGDWESALQKVEEELKKTVAAHKQSKTISAITLPAASNKKIELQELNDRLTAVEKECAIIKKAISMLAINA
jgi:ADP-heptose:LPS heptosyltransferase